MLYIYTIYSLASAKGSWAEVESPLFHSSSECKGRKDLLRRVPLRSMKQRDLMGFDEIWVQHLSGQISWTSTKTYQNWAQNWLDIHINNHQQSPICPSVCITSWSPKRSSVLTRGQKWQDYFALKREKNKPLSRESIKVPKLELGPDHWIN